MSTAHTAQDLPGYPPFSARGDRIVAVHKITIGASGAVASEVTDNAKFTATLDSTGTYTLTFPACPRGGAVSVTVKSAAGTVTHGYFTALDFTAGTATLKVASLTAVAEPASGDVIMLTYHLDKTLL